MAENEQKPLTDMEALVAQMMAEKLTLEAKNKLITDAIKSLLERGSGRYGASTPSPLENAFATAVENVAHKAVLEQVQSSAEIKAQIDALIAKTLSTMLQSEEFAGLVSDVIMKALSKTREALR